MSAPIVHIVDDDDSLRVALARLLRARGYETRAYRSAGDFLISGHEECAGCVLLDVEMPGPSGLDLQEALVKEGRPLPVIFLTGRGDIPMSVRAMRAGAVDFLTKPVDRERLMSAVATALAADEKRRKAQQHLRDLQERYRSLTLREREVFEGVAAGLLNKQIAAELGTSERTIKAHRAQVVDKMHVRSVAELVRVADRLKAAEDSPDAPPAP